MVKEFNVRSYIEKSWCTDESRFMRADIQELYRSAFQYIIKREKAVTGPEAAEAFRIALVDYLALIKNKVENHVTDEEINAAFTDPVKKLFPAGEYDNAKNEVPFANRMDAFVKSHKIYVTAKELKAFAAAFQKFMKAMYAQVKDYYVRAGLVRK